ncbi:Eco57I restriction-modification methylase domain-containing protein [Methanobacterium bryantii]|uniref:site-specific DNA-methyltransferase (adenine-specific) n=1 Tax=Methanobacterium bryantii TaxID=2161 RepID=A0A2A2H7T0_METBR|nr:DNA methyltransferase [Methanobacterium bryantii]PAV05457.1 hypothetical protein ASJ80_09420 [Methanobacterium bryantii]
MDIEFKKILKKQIIEINSAEGIFELFKTLKYPEEKMFDVTYKREITDFNFKKEDSERINGIYSILNFDENLPVFLLETCSLAPSFVRSVAHKFDNQYLRFLIILVNEEYSEMIFVLPDREKVEKGKYRLKITKLVINKDDIKERKEHYTVIDTLSKIMYEGESNWREIWRKWRESFNVEKVTEAFFEDYKNIFFKLRKSIQSSLVSPKGAHEYTLQFLNRVMFIYFISKKGWLKYPKFMHWFWRSYKEQNNFGSNEFHVKWLNQVFFKGFNNRSYDVKELPQDIKDVIISFPYLNGGLFKENKIDTCPVKIKDEVFQKIFEFFEKYNFTIKEDMPFESEVAVDPQMIGYVYETLASLSSKDVDIYTESEKKEDAESRRKWGIFYTPIIEVDFMCRRSLVDYLANYLPNLPKYHVYHFVFDAPGEFDKTEKYLTKEEWWDQIEDTLDNLSVVDPACGSGAFLVGMMNVLGELYGKVYKYTDTSLDDYQMKYRIIQRSLYGVDVMKWAVHAAELRLWLQLIIETNISGEELRRSPLLPNLNLNLRVGDSLVQEIGGMNFNLRSNDIDPALKKKLEELKHEKAQYFENPQRAKYKSIEAFHKQELKLFNSIIDSRIKIIQEGIESKDSRSKSKQVTLGAKTTIKAKNFDDKSNKKILAEIKENKTQVQNLRKMKKALKDSKNKPFVWEIDFAEIFGDKNGFDIVIGNPPYIRQEKIAPPQKNKTDISLKDKREYKDKLIDSVKSQFPVIKKLDKRSDYYIYFYFHGLSLLNKKGVFCFITSNSWLDVGYGKDLQEFLLKYVPIKAIYDNPKRSFVHADVNTIIALLGSPKFDKKSDKNSLREKENVDWLMLNNIAKFVMFKKPFEQVVHSENLIEIENIEASRGHEISELINNVIKTPNYRVFPVIQEDLLIEGWQYPKKYDKHKGKFKSGYYGGNIWGGKYLRAPDVFYTILERSKANLVKLCDVGDVKFGIKTGANEFFYFPSKYFDLEETKDYYSLIPKKDGPSGDFKIEKDYLKPVIKSPREFKSILLNKDDVKYKLLFCKENKTDKNSELNKYIEWGEMKGFNNRPTCSSRDIWYSSIELRSKYIIRSTFNEDFSIIYNEPRLLIDKVMYGIEPLENDELLELGSFLNSTIFSLFINLFGQMGLGQGALFITVERAKELPVISPLLNKEKMNKSFLKLMERKTNSILKECGFNPEKPIREQEPNPLPDRAELDDIIFDELELTAEERKEVYWSVCELVKQRIDKAKSLKV